MADRHIVQKAEIALVPTPEAARRAHARAKDRAPARLWNGLREAHSR